MLDGIERTAKAGSKNNFQSLSSAMFIRFTMKTNVDEKEKEGKKKLARFNVKGTVNSSPYALKCIHIG